MKNQTVFSTISPHFYTGTTVKSISTDFSSSCSLSMTNFLTEESLSIDSDNIYSSILAKDKFLFTGQSNGDFSIFDTQNFNKIFTNKVSQSDVHISYNFNKNLVALNKGNDILLFDINKESFFPSINLCNPVTCLQFNKKISHVLAIGTTNSLVLTDLRQKKILLQIATDKINQIDFNSTHNTTLVYQSKNLLHSFDLLNDKKQEMFFSNYFTLKNELLFSIDDEFISVYDMSYNLLANKNLTNVYQISFSKFYKDLFCINYLDGTFELETLSTFFNHKSLFTEQNNGILVYRHIKEPVISYDNHINTEEIKSIFEENSSCPVSKENEEELIVNTYTLYKSTTFRHTNKFKLNESIYYKLLKNTSINDLLTIKEKESFFDRKDPLLLNLVQGKITECINDSKGIQVNLSEVLSSYFSKESEFTNPCLLLLSLLNNSNLDLVLKVVHKNDWDILLLFIYNNIKCNLQLLYELGEKIECKEGSLLCYLLSKDLKKYINLRNNLPQASSIFKYYDFINEYFNFYYENKPILPEEETKTLKEFKSFINKTPLDEEKEIIDSNTEHFKKLIIKTQQENLKEKINTQKNQPMTKFNKINTEVNQSENQMKIPKPSKLLGTLNEVAEAHNKLVDSQSKPISKPSIPFPTPINNPSKYSTNYNTKVINNSTSLQDNKSVEEESFSKPKIPYSLSKDTSTNTSKNTYGSLKVKGPQISFESKQNIPLPTRNDSSPILPQINQNVCQLNTNVNQPINSEEIKNNINSIINYLKQESLNKKGLVYKSKTNSALKKLENFNVNSFNDPLLLRLLNYFNKINLEEIQNNKSNIKSKLLAALCFESDNICREMGGSGIEGFLQAVFALLQVVLA